MEKLKIGQKVSLLNGSEQGIIIKTLSNGKYLVEIDGFDMEFNENEIVAQFDFTSAKKGKVAANINLPKKLIPELEGIFFGFSKIKDKNGDLNQIKLEILNQEIVDFQVLVTAKLNLEYELLFNQKVPRKSSSEITTFSFLEAPNILQLGIQWIILPDGNKSKEGPIFKEKWIKIKLADVIQKANFNEFLKSECHLVKVEEERTSKTPKDEVVLPSPKLKITVPDEKDLHIEKLTTSLSIERVKMYPLEFQLNEFQHYIDLCVLSKKSSVVVIHGIGTGVLKKAVHDYLNERRDIIMHHRPANAAKYGEKGATEIYFVS